MKICRYKIYFYLSENKIQGMYFLKIPLTCISISFNSTNYPKFNLEASWGGCKPILLLNYCTSRETLLAWSTVANHIMFLYTILSLMLINSRYPISFNPHAVSHLIATNTAFIWLIGYNKEITLKVISSSTVPFVYKNLWMSCI